MKRVLNFFLAAMAVYFGTFSAFAAESELVDTGKVNAQLVATHDRAAPGQTFHIALRTVLDLEWHTYWRNPGDSGEPVQITWAAPDTVSHGDIIWPLPSPIATGPIINYGFEGVPFFPVPFTVSEDALPGDVLQIDADIYYLVCKDVCIPESTQLAIDIEIGEPLPDARWNPVINNAINVAPVAETVEAGIIKDNGRIRLNISGLESADAADAYYFPFEQGIIDHSAPQKVHIGETGFQIETTPGFDWENGVPMSADGLIKFVRNGNPAGANIQVNVGSLPEIGLASKAADVPGASIGLLAAIFSALIGGLILNLFPCVFPVISLKALNIAKKAHGERGEVRRQAWLYTIGVLTTFIVLTAILIGIKAGGAEIGWGFQLQSPVLVAFLALLFFLIALNLLGMFEIGSGLQGMGGGLTNNQGWTGSFFTGVLAVIVATPCTAPLMAGAIGYALTAPTLATFAVFMALGFGFALPFLLIAYIPGLVNRLPRPGTWMVRFKEFLAFPMFGAVIWLVWVLSVQSGDQGLLRILIALLAAAFAIWLLKRRGLVVRILAGVCILLAAAMPMSLRPAGETAQIEGIAWSPETVQALRAEGRPVFVDFTAAWCVTCKVNERLVLKTDEVQQAFRDTNTAFVIADWTNKNDAIARELESYGRAGVPLYLLFTPGNNDVKAEILPQTLRKDMVIEKLHKNSRS